MRMIPKFGIVLSVTAILLSACSSGESDESAKTDAVNKSSIVVTYSVIGSIVEQLVGDLATVTVLIPDGQDPH